MGTLLRTTLAQAGVVRDVIERGAREGRARLDDVRRGRRRDEALARLGAAVLDAVRAGELSDVYEISGAAAALGELDEIDSDNDGIASASAHATSWVAPNIREQFDRRDAGADHSGDGTVSSSTWRPSPAAGSSAVWRPPAEQPIPPRRSDSKLTERTPSIEPGARFGENRKGGILFAADDDDDDVEDLSAYMNPDDVIRVGDDTDA